MRCQGLLVPSPAVAGGGIQVLDTPQTVWCEVRRSAGLVCGLRCWYDVTSRHSNPRAPVETPIIPISPAFTGVSFWRGLASTDKGGAGNAGPWDDNRLETGTNLTLNLEMAHENDRPQAVQARHAKYAC